MNDRCSAVGIVLPLRNITFSTTFSGNFGLVRTMTAAQKKLAAMRNNPRDWRIEDIKAVAERHGLTWDQPGTSHVTFRTPAGGKVTVPAHRPIKPIYVRQFVALIDSLEGSANE